MSDAIIQTAIIVGGILAIVWPVIYLFKSENDGTSALNKTKKQIEANRLQDEARKQLNGGTK